MTEANNSFKDLLLVLGVTFLSFLMLICNLSSWFINGLVAEVEG
jgi:hypothetical protein